MPVSVQTAIHDDRVDLSRAFNEKTLVQIPLTGGNVLVQAKVNLYNSGATPAAATAWLLQTDPNNPGDAIMLDQAGPPGGYFEIAGQANTVIYLVGWITNAPPGTIVSLRCGVVSGFCDNARMTVMHVDNLT